MNTNPYLLFRNCHFLAIAAALFICSGIVCNSSLSAESKPNILLIAVDDMGYSDISPFGGEIATPNLDALANQGVKFTNFYAGPSCSATRSMLLTGHDNHVAGLGNMYERLSENQKGKPGYEGSLNERVISVASILKKAQYHTYMAGKWHLGHTPEQDPSKRGFSRSFTLLQGGASHFDDEWMMYASYTPTYREDGVRTRVPKGFYSTEFYTNQIIKYIDEQKDSKPFFAYLAYTAPHDPLHVPDKWLEHGKGDYEKGYNQLRKQRLARMKAMGILPKGADLGPWVKGIPTWKELSHEQKKHEIRRMEIYAAMVNNIDHHVGRVIDYLEKSGKRENTLILFFSDNGANGFEMHMYPGTDEAWVERNSDNRIENWGKRASRIAQGPGWAQASSTPFHLYKHYLAEGGIRSPLIISGPGVAFKGETVHAVSHVMDLAPTFMELAGTSYPKTHEGEKMEQPLGKSLVSFLSKDKPFIYGPNDPLGWEYNDLKAIRMGNYKASWAVKPYGTEKWQVYDLSKDPGESIDISGKDPELTKRLIEAYDNFAQRVGVIPLEAATK
ncbi:arylsulfatase [Verrucomicrobiaceae bacterium N1E253]|uniref:Arylsulfatase n=1 Tax=Oceaniferula marina TaxID=2748318 RepID=A0A851GLN1_9BACT|nr:arylsulfatase [Oceaniferula marina]NWK56075.1 arylsulfatase [Oceaniferula marina]